MKRILSALLSCVILCSMIPWSVYAHSRDNYGKYIGHYYVPHDEYMAHFGDELEIYEITNDYVSFDYQDHHSGHATSFYADKAYFTNEYTAVGSGKYLFAVSDIEVKVEFVLTFFNDHINLAWDSDIIRANNADPHSVDFYLSDENGFISSHVSGSDGELSVGDYYIAVRDKKMIVADLTDSKHSIVSENVKWRYFSDGKYLYYSKYDDTVYRLDLETMDEVYLFTAQDVFLRCTDNKYLLYEYRYPGSEDSEDVYVGVYDIQTGENYYIDHYYCSVGISNERIVYSHHRGQYSPVELWTADVNGDNKVLITDKALSCYVDNGYIYYAEAQDDSAQPSFVVKRCDMYGDNMTELTSTINNAYATVTQDYVECVVYNNNIPQTSRIYYDKNQIFSTVQTEWKTGEYEEIVTVNQIYDKSDINVIINNKKINFETPPIIVNARTLVPMRKIFEALGATVEWNGGTKTITAKKANTTTVITIGESRIIVNGNEVAIDTQAMLIDGVTYVPVRVIAEAFDADVSWNQNTRTVSITTQSPSSTTAQKTSSEVKPGKVITGNSEYDNLIFEHNKNIPLKTVVDDFDGDGLNEVIAIYGSIKDKKTNRAYGDAVVYNFAGQFSGKYILDSRNFYLDQIKIVPVSNGDEEQKGLQFRVGYDSLRLDYIYVYDGDRFVETEKLGGTALPEERSQEEEWESVKLDRWFANFDIMINYLKDRNEWHALEWNESAYDTYTNINGENVLEKSEKPYFYTSYFQDIYEYDAIEVTPEFLKTFEGGNSLYKYCINEKKKGNKVQVLYRANGYVHINLRQYNEKVGLVHNTNKTYRTYKGNISSYESTNGIYHKTNTDWWTPRIQLDPSNVAWQYQTDTSEDFNDVSSLFEGHTLTNELSATVDDENISERIAIARANLLLKNSNYEFLKKLNGVDKAFAGNLNAALPAAYHSLNNYRSQLLKSAGLPTNYKTFYELVLIDLLSYKVDSDNITSMMEKTLSVIESYVYAGYKETKNRRKVVNNILKFMCIEKDANYKLFDDTIGDIFKLIDSGKASIEEGTKMISAMTEFNKYADEKMTVLDSIYEKTDDNELKKACVSVKQYVNAAKNKNMSSFKSKLDIQTEVTLNEIVDWEIDSFTDIIVDEMIKGVEGVSSAAGSVLIGAKAGKDIGLLIGNQLFDADNMTTAMLTLDTLCKIDDTLKSVLNGTEAKYKSDMTYENAITLTTAADLSKTLQMYSCDVTKDLVNSVKKNEQNMYKYAPILPYNSILTITKRAMGKMPDYDYLEQTLDKLKGQFEAMDLYMGGIDIAEYIYSDKSTESSDWSKPYIERARRYAILPDYLCMGYKRGITRTEFCTYIVNLLEAKTEKNINDLITEKGQLVTSPFDDCTYYYVDCVYKLGIISGMSDNEFKPLGNLTREQAAKILFETAKILGIDTSASASNLTGVSEWAKDGVNFVVDRNIMTGTDNGFEPQSGYSKEQALTSLVRFYENLK